MISGRKIWSYLSVMKRFSGVFLCFAISACGQAKLNFDEMLTVAMVGSFTAPVDAAGNAEPKSMTFSVEDVFLTAPDGSVVDLYEEETPYEVRVISRSQIVHEASVADYVGVTYGKLSVRMAAAVKAAGKIEDEMTVNLPAPVLEYVDTIAIEKAKGLRLDIKVQWKNIVARDEAADPPTETISAPSFELELATN